MIDKKVFLIFKMSDNYYRKTWKMYLRNKYNYTNIKIMSACKDGKPSGPYEVTWFEGVEDGRHTYKTEICPTLFIAQSLAVSTYLRLNHPELLLAS